MISMRLVRLRNTKPVTLEREDLTKIANEAMRLIRKRCAAGRDIFDQPFKPLSKEYAEEKAKHGRAPVRNLSNSGAMLTSMCITHIDNAVVEVGWTNSKELIIAIANNKRDQWFPISGSEQRALVQYAQQLLINKIRRA